MHMDIVEQRDNPFFKRKDITVLLRHDTSATPSKAELVKAVAEKSGVDESQVVVSYISSKKGVQESLAKVMVLNEKPPAPKQEEKKEGAADEAQAGQGQ